MKSLLDAFFWKTEALSPSAGLQELRREIDGVSGGGHILNNHQALRSTLRNKASSKFKISFKVAFVASQGIFILSPILTIEAQLGFLIFYFNLYYNFLEIMINLFWSLLVHKSYDI